jgi:hypothetical protein
MIRALPQPRFWPRDFDRVPLGQIPDDCEFDLFSIRVPAADQGDPLGGIARIFVK